MNDLKPLIVFAETVAAGSMSAAARRLGMSPSAVSQSIRALEQQTGITLLHRSTRKLTLTEVGERYYPHCKRVSEAVRAAAESLMQACETPTGELRVSAPVGFANHIAPALEPLLSEAPQLRLRLLVDDAMIDLIDARIDVAIRVGRLADSSWIARHLCDFEMILCASPDYLDRCGTPAVPQDLLTHQWLAFGRGVDSQVVATTLNLQNADGQNQNLAVDARITSNNQIALQQMCEHGLGLACLVRADVLTSLQRGTLIQVLVSWRLPTLPVWAVTPRRESEEAKVRLALNYLRLHFGALPGSVSPRLDGNSYK